MKKGNSSISCSNVKNRLREEKSWSQTKTEGNTPTLRGKQQINKNIEVQQKQT